MAKQQRERAVRERRERKAERKREQAHLKLAGTSDEQSPETTDDTEPGLRLVASGEDAEQAPATASSVDSGAAAENTIDGEQDSVHGEVSTRGVSAPDS